MQNEFLYNEFRLEDTEEEEADIDTPDEDEDKDEDEEGSEMAGGIPDDEEEMI